MISPEKKKVIVGMSGGVDSSVSALLLQQEGYEVEGLFMKNWDEDDGSEYCTAKQDLKDAQLVCDKLGIKLHQANFAAEYWDNVFDHFLQEYQAGRTPNPDVLCNKEIKFKVFKEYAEVLGCDYIATGHYARLKTINGKQVLLKGLDSNKDQSYFLHAVTEEQFANVIFPIGELPKSKVRQIAQQHGLVTHNKKDSTGICFIGERRFKDFLQQYIPAQPGLIVTKDEQTQKETIIGEHSGLMYYTIGQRQGLGIGGLKNFSEEPWFVSEKDLSTKKLYVVQGTHHSQLLKDQLICNTAHWHWINEAPALPFQGKAKTRYRQSDQECLIDYLASDPTFYRVSFKNKQRAITPGQYLVLYDGDVCLGGGVIHQAFNYRN
jgi:tRNA-uridine 2-sulfurtransferase